MPGRMGIPRTSTSNYEKFEAPDPAEWTARGYAVVCIDSRGSWDSQGYLWLVPRVNSVFFSISDRG